MTRPRLIPIAGVLGVILVVVIALLAGAGSGGPQPTNPLAPTVQDIAKGHDLFEQTCAACHGVDAHGGGPLANTTQLPPPALAGPGSHLGAHSDADLFRFISDGLPGGMPSWASQLSEEDRWRIILWLRSIQ